MPAIYDAATVLMPHATYSSNQSFAPIQVYPRQLAATMLEVHMAPPPAASCTLTVEVASTSAGVYSPITSITWPAGVAGSRTVAFGVNASLAKFVNNQSVWLRASLVTSGALTGSAWLAKPGGAVGTGSEPGDLFTGTAA
jgi:hypothetical protein